MKDGYDAIGDDSIRSFTSYKSGKSDQSDPFDNSININSTNSKMATLMKEINDLKIVNQRVQQLLNQERKAKKRLEATVDKLHDEIDEYEDNGGNTRTRTRQGPYWEDSCSGCKFW